MPEPDIYKLAIDSISAHIAILNESGVIVDTNRAWREYAEVNDLNGPTDCIGMNYLSICDAAAEDFPEAAQIAEGIRKVLKGELQEFFTHYPCHSPVEQRWYALRAVRLRGIGKKQIVVSHENITPIITAQEALKKKEEELQEEKEKLEETNVALKVLLQHREVDRRKMEEAILMNVRELILPYTEKLKSGRLQKAEQTFVEIIEERLQEII